jgi:hypothetical protein
MGLAIAVLILSVGLRKASKRSSLFRTLTIVLNSAATLLRCVLMCECVCACRYCGGTEIGGGFLSGCLWRPQAPSTFATPSLGSQLVLMTDLGQIRLPCDTAHSITG